MSKFSNKSIRSPNWDYRSPGAYFITICTAGQEHYFGKIENGKMILSQTGILADVLWHEIKNHTKNVDIDVFQVMPNHIHGILILKSGFSGSSADLVGGSMHASNHTENAPNQSDKITKIHNKRGTGDKSLTTHQNKPSKEFMKSISPKPGSLSRIIGSYKSAVTRHARRLGFEFEWQRSFYDQIIHDNESLYWIRKYVIDNPADWHSDEIKK